jgi:hypothetical protein
MFDDGSRDRIVAHVEAHAGMRICYGCLTEALGVTHDQVRRASWHLKDRPGVSIRPGRCRVCHRRCVTIAIARSGTETMPRLVNAGEGSVSMPSAHGSDVPLVSGLGAHLRRYAGLLFCAHCLARELGALPADTREAMWALEREPGFSLRTAQCAGCLLSRPVIQFDQATPEQDGARRVLTFFARASGEAFCAACVALTADLGLAETRQLLASLIAGEALDPDEAECHACGRAQAVVRLRGGEDTARVQDAGDVASGRVRHRGFRVDLLSFKTPAGWRPLAIVKTSAGALLPDVPEIAFAVKSTKPEADELALAATRAWLDEHVA